MTEGNSAAVHVDLFWIQLELARYGNGRNREGLIELNEVHILVAVPAGFREQLLDGVHRRHHHPFGLNAADSLSHDARDRLLPEPRRISFAGDDERRRAVVRAGSIAGRHRAIFLERGFQLGQRFQRRVFARRLVVLDDDGLAFFLRNFDGQNLRLEEAGLPGAHSLLVTFDGEAILLLPRDAVFFGDQFTGHAHMKIFVRVPKAIVNHRVDQLTIADAIPGARLRQKIWAVRHGLHAAGHHNFRFAELHGLRRERHRFQSRAADFVDGHGRNARLAAAFERRLARGILAEARLNDVAENGFVHLFGFEPGAADGFRDSFAAEFRCGETGETTLKFSDGGANSGQNDGGFHGEPPGERRAILYRDAREAAEPRVNFR